MGRYELKGKTREEAAGAAGWLERPALHLGRKREEGGITLRHAQGKKRPLHARDASRLPQDAERVIVIRRSAAAEFPQASGKLLGHLRRLTDRQALNQGEKPLSLQHLAARIAGFGDSVGVKNQKIIRLKTHGYLHIVRAFNDAQRETLDSVRQGR